MKYLKKINSPSDLKKFDINELPAICEEIREFLIHSVSKTGGHLASNLGTIELTVALHYVFSSPKDKFIWDVGHQTYTHKVLTGRREKLNTVRKLNGLSGFPKTEESKHDHYNSGHAGISISQAIGESVAANLKGSKAKKKNSIISIIGDASIATGISFEAMNHAGYLKIPFLVILNDNEMSISQNIGSMSYILTSLINTRLYKGWRHLFFNFVRRIPLIGSISERTMLRFGANMKSILTEHQFFEELGFRYLGPLDGHNVIKLVLMLRKLKNIDTPNLLHVVTKKGKGYHPAEENPTQYHGVSPFEKKKGIVSVNSEIWNLSEFVGHTLTELAKKDRKICVITPAMKEGSGLTKFAEKYPDRFFDTGIAEQHAVTFAAALAKAGLKPFLCIYSTFLQRGYDQLIHDIALMKLPVRIVIDRAGIVGGDGETHQGTFDISYITAVPNVSLLSASGAKPLIGALEYLSGYEKGPIAVRFSKESENKKEFLKWVEKRSKKSYSATSSYNAQVALAGNDALIIAEGNMLKNSLEAASMLKKKNITLEVIELNSIQPLDIKTLAKRIQSKRFIFSIENHCLSGGIGERIQSRLSESLDRKVYTALGFPDLFIEHGTAFEIQKKYKLDGVNLATTIENTILSNKNMNSKIINF